MKVIIFTEVFLGQWLNFTKLSKNLIGGAEVYLYELATGPLSDIFDQIDVYQLSGDSGQLTDKIGVKTVAKYDGAFVDGADLLITNNGFSFPKTSNALKMVRRKYPSVKIINIHHGAIVKPTIFNSANCAYYSSGFLYNHSGLSGQLKLLKQLLIWEPRRASIVLRMNDLTRYVDGVVSVDANSLQFILPTLRPKWHVVFNAVDLSCFSASPVPANKVKVVLVPRNLRYERGIPLIPNVVRIVQENTKVPFEMWIAGTGEFQRYVEDKAQEMGLHDVIKLIGHQDHFKDMPDLYKKADIVVVPTFTDEGTSLSVLEAMASGRPVVTTDVGGLRDIGFNKQHKLSSKFDANEIACNIVRLLENEALASRIAASAVQLVSELHNLNRWSENWKQIIEHIVSK